LKTTIYIEGGGNTAHLRSELRKGFQALFKNAGFSGRLPKIVACGSRNEAFEDFKTAFSAKSNDDAILLLVDSEDVVKKSEKWKHVEDRDGWKKHDNMSENNIFLMVVAMESWFLADTDALEKFFGDGFDKKKLPQNQNFEVIDKNTLYDGLKKSTKNSSKGEYCKGEHSFKILSLLDANKVKKHGSYSKEFFEHLNKILKKEKG